MSLAHDDLALLVLLFVVFVKAPRHLYLWFQLRRREGEIRLLKEAIKRGKDDTAGLNTPDTFVRYAKATREINTKEKRLQKLTDAIQSLHQWRYTRPLFFLQVGVLVGLWWLYGNVAVVQLGFRLEGMMGRLLNRNGDPLSLDLGEIYLLPWIFLTRAAVDALLQAFAPLRSPV